MKATVSVVVPVFNNALFIGECISSLLKQTIKADEILIIDDGSTDHLEDAIEIFRDKIKFYQFKKNKGAAAARNFGTSKANGEIIVFQDADDVAVPQRIALTIKAFENKNCHYAIGGIENFNDETGLDKNRLTNLAKIVPATSSRGSGTLAIKKNVLLTVGEFDCTLSIGSDADWLLRAHLKGYKPCYIYQTIIKRRIHQNNISGLTTADLNRLKTDLLLKNIKLKLKNIKSGELQNNNYSLQPSTIKITLIINAEDFKSTRITQIADSFRLHFKNLFIIIYSSDNSLPWKNNLLHIKTKGINGLNQAISEVSSPYFFLATKNIIFKQAELIAMLNLLANRGTFPFIFGFAKDSVKSVPENYLDSGLAIFKKESLRAYGKLKDYLGTSAWLDFFFWHREQGHTFPFYRKNVCESYSYNAPHIDDLRHAEQESLKRREQKQFMSLIPFPKAYSGPAMNHFFNTPDPKLQNK